MSLTERLINEPKIVLNDKYKREEFELVYLDYGPNKFIIQAFNRNQFIGVCQIKNSTANLPFDKNYRLDNEHKAAICVSKEIRERYSGIGTTLLFFAMDICRYNENEIFNVVANRKSHHFYEKLGFKLNYTEDNNDVINPIIPDRWYFSYDLNQQLPEKEITRVQ